MSYLFDNYNLAVLDSSFFSSKFNYFKFQDKKFLVFDENKIKLLEFE